MIRTPRFLAVALGVSLSAVCLLAATSLASPALADSTWWQLSSSTRPANLAPGGKGAVLLSATNLGDAIANGKTSPITIADTLPAGLTATAIKAEAGLYSPLDPGEQDAYRGEVKCLLATLTCTYEGKLPAYERIWVEISVEVTGAVTSGNEARITGGGAPEASVKRPLNVTSAPTSFGIEDYEIVPEEEGGAIDTQAGSHPFQLTSTFALNQTADYPYQPAQPKDEHFDLPVGLVGDPTAFPQCTDAEFSDVGDEKENACPIDSQIGVAMVTVQTVGKGAGGALGQFTMSVPLFNIEPAVGEPARFGFEAEAVPVLLDTAVRTGSNYGLEVKVENTTQAAALLGARVTFWGVPGDSRHNSSRSWRCVFGESEPVIEAEACSASSSFKAPFLTLPTSCGGAFETSASIDSWSDPGVFTEPTSYTLHDSHGEALGMDSCNRLPFGPAIEVAPDGQAAATPTGLTVSVRVPQEGSLNPEGEADADIRSTTVTLPEGVALNPADADGLQACSIGQIGFTGGVNPQTGGEEFTPSYPSCPNAAKVATAKITTPLLPNPLEGAVYLASPQNFAGPLENPFGSLVAMYIVAEDPVSGTLVKLPGKVTPNPVTGQLTATFEGTPQLPFEDLELHFFGTDRSPLSTPSHCGTYTTQASFTPWSGTETISSTSSFQITSGPNGTPCPGSSLAFTPSLTAGTTNLQAGAFSPLTTTISREDGQQNIQAVQLHMPAGLSGILAGVKLCGEAEADAGTCGAESLIGSTIVSVGLGGDPYTVTGGKVYLTGPYEGAPFGLSIVNPAVAGPFNLGNVIVRAKIEVDPHTAALTITTDNSGAYKIPSILDGIPLQIKHVNVTIERPGFTFNPTDCNPAQITGSVSSVEGSTAPVAVPFQVTNCAVLKFAPKFSASTTGQSTKAAGASLSVKLSYPAGAEGTQANIAKAKVDLPKQLPSELKTLQKACLAAVFEANPANCKPESIVGHATVTTPLLPVPLTGPAYFVSHGGEAFPSLTLVLQGYGVTIDLVGTTLIRKGITSTTFNTVPDVPFNTFELTLPQGEYSALAANLPNSAKGSFCGQKLEMPTAFVAQNGAEIHETTPIAVEGCSSSLAIPSHSVKGRKVSVSVYAPAAGKLTASGKGLTKVTKTASGRELVTLTLTATRSGKFDTKVKIAFAPTKGKKSSKSVSVKLPKG